MHEYAIVGALIEQVAREADARHARVHRLHVAIGELAGVDVELLRTAYDTFRPETVCADAALSVRAIAAAWCCPRCGHSLTRGALLQCPDCRRPARLAAGDEIVLEKIEMEVPDV